MIGSSNIHVSAPFPHHLRDIRKELIVDSFCGGGGLL